VAHQSPAACTTSGIRFQLGGSGDSSIGIIHRNGDVVSVIPRVGNFGTGACDITDATVTLQFPKPDGTPGGQTVTLTNDIDLPGGAPFHEFPAVEHTVNFDDGVFRGQVTLAVSGTQHFPGGDTTGAIGSLGSPLVISRPHATVSVTPTPAAGDAPLGVTYAYSVTNDSPLNPMDVPVHLNDPNLSDDRCSPVTFTGGDANMDTLLSRGETWTYTCSTIFPGGTFTNTATLTGTSVRDGRPWPAATAQSTVNVNGPDMTLTKSHAGDFTQGDTGRTYTLVARNSGNRQSTGAVSVADTLPAGLTATAISGDGWTCDAGTVSCSRSDTLAAGASYPPITVTVDVAADAPGSVVNTASVSRSGENAANDRATDPTTIVAKPGPVGDGPAAQNGPGAGGGDGGGTDRGSGDVVVPDTLAPTVQAARLTNRTFAVDARGAAEPVVTSRAKKGTSFVYALSEPARVVFTVERKDAGRRVGSSCRKPSRSNRRGRPCVRLVKVGSFAQDGAAGPNTRKWSGKVGTKALKPANYQASLTAEDAAGNASAAKRLPFRIVRR